MLKEGSAHTLLKVLNRNLKRALIGRDQVSYQLALPTGQSERVLHFYSALVLSVCHPLIVISDNVSCNILFLFVLLLINDEPKGKNLLIMIVIIIVTRYY